LPHFFGGAKKRVGRRDEHPATPHGSERRNASSARQTQQRRLALALRNRNRNHPCAKPAPSAAAPLSFSYPPQGTPA
jgi:hypothetical protein